MTSELVIKDLRVAVDDGAKEVLKGVNLTIRQGEVHALMGPNGSGKSTLLKVASGILLPQAGEALYRATPLSRWSKKLLAKEVAFVAQDLSLDLDFTIEELVSLGRTPHLSSLGWESERDRQIANRAMQETDILEFRHRSAMEISGGERQRAFIAMALAQEPAFMLLDEPVSHLDVRHQFEVMSLLSRLNEAGMTLLITSHDLNLAAAYCRRIVLLSDGQVAGDAPPDAVLTPDKIREVYGVEAVCGTNPLNGKLHLTLAEAQGQASGERG